MIVHPFDPLYDENSEILILGSFPSVKSREQMFYYGHPQNRFWKVMAFALGEDVPQTIEEKKAMLFKHHVALWDTIYSCEITGSSDASIKNAVPNDIAGLVKKTNIRHVYCNGKASYKLYMKYIDGDMDLPVTDLPSSSPANAVWTLEKLCAKWASEIDIGD